MNELYVLRHKNGKYYSDGEFIEPEKKFAKKLRQGQAEAIKREQDIRHCSLKSPYDSLISIEKA